MVLRPAEHAATKIIKSSKCFVKSRRHESIFFVCFLGVFFVVFFFSKILNNVQQIMNNSHTVAFCKGQE